MEGLRPILGIIASVFLIREALIYGNKHFGVNKEHPEFKEFR